MEEAIAGVSCPFRVFARREICGVAHRSMFGYPCCFVNGNMFIGLHQDNLVIRLEAKQRDAFLGQPGTKPFEPIPGRRIKEYVVASEAMLDNPASVKPWIAKSLAYGLTLPPKIAKGGDARPPP